MHKTRYQRERVSMQHSGLRRQEGKAHGGAITRPAPRTSPASDDKTSREEMLVCTGRDRERGILGQTPVSLTCLALTFLQVREWVRQTQGALRPTPHGTDGTASTGPPSNAHWSPSMHAPLRRADIAARRAADAAAAAVGFSTTLRWICRNYSLTHLVCYSRLPLGAAGAECSVAVPPWVHPCSRFHPRLQKLTHSTECWCLSVRLNGGILGTSLQRRPPR